MPWYLKTWRQIKLENIIDSSKLMIYRNFKHQDLFDNFVWLINNCENDYYNREDKVKLFYDCINQLLELADNYGFEGNLFHCFLGFLLANNENAFSTSCEIIGVSDGTINTIALHDLDIFRQLFEYDMKKIDAALNVDGFSMVSNYKNGGKTSKVFNKRVRDRINELTQALDMCYNAKMYFEKVTEFYKSNGVGKFGLHKAFRLVCEENSETQIVPITSVEHIYLDDLVGYELQKKKLIDNTEAFVEGRKANNALLFGDSGTGKSSSIKAILNEYYDKGLRMIEVYKHQFRCLSEVIETIKDRNYKFIIYMDDLSFEDFEIEYKYLKAIIEGGLGKKPDNVLIYATSNRRHLVREKYSDKEDRAEDLHTSDTVQEKLSLVARFGVSIYYIAPDKKEYQKIVKTLADKYNISMSEEELYLEANKWELSHGGLSGRTATQFINYLLGKSSSL